MSTLVVTGYIPLQGHPRSAAEYGALGEQVFKPLAQMQQPIQPYYETIDMCWLSRYMPRGVTHSAGDNPDKNTLAYHVVQHQKFAWMLKAALRQPTFDTYVWIDYGIAHVPGVNASVIHDFLQTIKKDDFAIPGCWPKENAINTDFFPCWRFCGGLMVMPRQIIPQVYTTIKRVTRDHMRKTNNVTWEVNDLARAEKDKKFPKVRWYQADHDQTMFTEYAK